MIEIQNRSLAGLKNLNRFGFKTISLLLDLYFSFSKNIFLYYKF